MSLAQAQVATSQENADKAAITLAPKLTVPTWGWLPAPNCDQAPEPLPSQVYRSVHQLNASELVTGRVLITRRST